MRLFDSHCHISDEAFDENRDAMIEEIRASSVALCTDVGSDLATSLKCAETAQKYGFVYAAAGCHPHEAKNFDEAQLEQILALLNLPKVKALGEIGLDYHYDFSPRDVQQYWFAAQLSAAKECGAPIIIHSREAEEDTMRILKDAGSFLKPGGSVFLEIGSTQAEAVTGLMKENGFDTADVVRDLAGLPRVVWGTLQTGPLCSVTVA